MSDNQRAVDGGPRHGTKHSMSRRCFDWDYTRPCIYQITIVLAERGSNALGEIVVDEVGEGGRPVAAHCEKTELGRVILGHWLKIGDFTPEIKPLFCQIMPDHLHAILRVVRPMKRPLGNAIGGFKTGCEKLFQSFSRGLAPSLPNKPCPVGAAPAVPSSGVAPAVPSSGVAPAVEAPRLFAAGFQDTILFHEGQLENMFTYLRSNPLRLAVKRWAPMLFKVARDLEVPLGPVGVGHFSVIGNHFLLTRHELRQVQVSRRYFAYRRDARGKILREEPPAVSTAEFAVKLADALAAAKRGAVLVSPCVSEGEREIARQAFVAGGRVITLQNKGFSPLYKPGGKLFDQCADGKLLMMAPAAWPYLPGKKPMTRMDACVLNRIAQLLSGDGAVEIDYNGVRLDGVEAAVASATKASNAGVKKCDCYEGC